MKIALVFLCFAALILASTNAKPAKGSTKASLKKKPTCVKECGADYNPVCAGDGTGKNNKSFGNECVLANHNCEQGTTLKVVSQGECPGGGGVRLS